MRKLLLTMSLPTSMKLAFVIVLCAAILSGCAAVGYTEEADGNSEAKRRAYAEAKAFAQALARAYAEAYAEAKAKGQTEAEAKAMARAMALSY